MRTIFLIWALLALGAGEWVSAEEGNKAPPAETLQIEGGAISGINVEGKMPVRAYLGVPFAAPPIGPLRWKPPQPPLAWEGVLCCADFGAACPQPKALLSGPVVRQSEDCLYLNVWTSAKTAGAKLPVMVWIHGGGCTTGAGSQPFYNGVQLAQAGVVAVTINYRLGIFGFLAYPLLSKESAHNVSGNYGALDQIAALQWVQRNIKAFGGDPECVTIFGESAGAASVSRLLVSPLAKGLFHRAIAESGGPFGHNRHLREKWYNEEPMEQVGLKLAEKLGCAAAPDPLAALRAKTADELLAVADAAVGLYAKGTRYGWVVDGWVLPDDPGVLFEAGPAQAVPLLTGSNANEGTVFLKNLPIQREIGYRWFLEKALGSAAAGMEMEKLFPVENGDIRAALDRVTTAAAFAWPARAMVRAMEKVKAPAYLYQFVKAPAHEGPNKLGACHALEIPYVFGNLSQLKALRLEDADRALSQTMVAYWTNFAKTGNPNGAGLPQWPAYRAAEDAYLELEATPVAKTGLFKEACELLDPLNENRMRNLDQGKNDGPAIEP